MIRGACPGLHAPMPTADGLLVRVKPPLGRLSSKAALILAAAAARHGNGIIELTSRANLQIRGLTTASAPRFAAEMVAAGLAHPDPAAERRRNLLAPPLAGSDPTGADPTGAADSETLTAALEALLIATPALDVLPDKFLFAIDAGGICPTPPIADITLRSDGARHWIVAAGHQAPCPDLAAVVTLARHAGNRRTRDVPALELFAAAGLTAEPVTVQVPQTQVGPLPGAFAIALPFGQTNATTLAALADLARRHADGQIRLAAGRIVVLAGIDVPETLAEGAAALGLITDPADPRLRIAACIGSAGCASGTTPTRSDAAILSAIGFAGFLHLSGCAKGCAHGPADHTLVGRDGRYDLVRHGRASDPPVRRDLSLAEAAMELA